MHKIIYFFTLLFLLGTGSSFGSEMMNFTIESSAFTANNLIPRQYSCDGANVSPPLTWNNAPPNTVTFVLIVEDPDAPVGVWDHWVLFNIPPGIHQLSEGSQPPDGALAGKNSYGQLSYNGPCPPAGTHRYYFKLYALDTALSFSDAPNKNTLISAMQGHIIAEAKLIGLYKR